MFHQKFGVSLWMKGPSQDRLRAMSHFKSTLGLDCCDYLVLTLKVFSLTAMNIPVNMQEILSVNL